MYQRPYIGRRIDVFCVGMEDPYSVPIDFLRECPKMSSFLETDHWSERIYLEDIGDAVGHVIIHFLHTGIYQSLRTEERSPREEQIVELRTSIRVYVAARAYGLPRLADLASLQTELLSDNLAFRTILEVLEEAYPHPPVDDTWISDYLKSRIRALLSQPGAFCVGDKDEQRTTSIAQICVQSVINLFQAKPTPQVSVGIPDEADQENAAPAMDPMESVPSPIVDHCVASEHSVAEGVEDPLEDHVLLEPRVYQSKQSPIAEATQDPDAVSLGPEKAASPPTNYSIPEEEASPEDLSARQDEEDLYAKSPTAEEVYPEETVLAGDQYAYAFPETPVTEVEGWPPRESPMREVEDFPREESPVLESDDYPLAEPPVPEIIEDPASEEPMPVESDISIHEAFEEPVPYEPLPKTMFDLNSSYGALVAEDPNHEATSSIQDAPWCSHKKKGKRCSKCKKAGKSIRVNDLGLMESPIEGH